MLDWKWGFSTLSPHSWEPFNVCSQYQHRKALQGKSSPFSYSWGNYFYGEE